VLGPVEYVVGAVRALELLDPAPNLLVLAEYLAGLGQRLFFPPNVGGWREGRAWISTRAAIGRANFAAGLMRGIDCGLSEAVDALGLARRHGRGDNLKDLIRFYAELLLGGLPSAEWGDRLLTRSPAGGPWGRHPACRSNGRQDACPTVARHIVALILASPEGQLL
jgi:hypothetical protein